MPSKANHSRRRAAKRPVRPLHRQFFLHPVTVLALLGIGVILTCASLPGQADDLLVTATVHAPPLTQPAIITSPQDQAHLKESPITVIGTCPDSSYVKLFRNGAFSGVAQCAAGMFQIVTSLSLGANQLQARVFNKTDLEGPQSPPITVYLDEPAPKAEPDQTTPTPQGGTAGPGGRCIGPEPHILVDYKYQTHFQTELWTWNLQLKGCYPFKLVIEWGDGRTAIVERDKDELFAIHHVFDQAGTYQPLIRATDANGEVAVLQLSAVVRGLPSPIQSVRNPLESLRDYLWAAWPAYAIVLLMTVSFWLGEQEIIRKLGQWRARR